MRKPLTQFAKAWKMKSKIVGLLALCLLLCPMIANAQQKPAAIAPAEAAKDGRWDEIDQRLVFLMVRLANVEASLDAVENAIAKSSGKRASNLGAAKRAEQGNELMDRKAGGPLKWSEFYGRTAEKFFYHPTDKNTSYHTVTVLGQNGPAADNKVDGGVPASQGLPVHQRPPQFDYIYRANRDAQAKAARDAAELKNKITELMARRTTLEAEQSALWCEVAFRAVSRYDLARKPLYRFEPLAASVESDDQQRAEAMKAAAVFMRIALSIVAEAQKDQAKAFGNIKTVVADAREKLDDNWIRQAVLVAEIADLKTPPGKFVALAKRLDDVSSNLSESYDVSIDGDRFKDEQRKETFRALLQESLVNYAQLVLALDEMSVLMSNEWRIKPDLDHPYETTRLRLMERPMRTGMSGSRAKPDVGAKNWNQLVGAYRTGDPGQNRIADRLILDTSADGTPQLFREKAGVRGKGTIEARQDGEAWLFNWGKQNPDLFVVVPRDSGGIIFRVYWKACLQGFERASIQNRSADEEAEFVRISEDKSPANSSNNRGIDLARRLAGTKWIDTWNKDFEWDDAGVFRTGLGGKGWWKPSYEVLGENKISINYGPNNVCTVVFDKNLRTFIQYSQGGKAITTGRRTD
jgi:hypothetical protein